MLKKLFSTTLIAIILIVFPKEVSANTGFDTLGSFFQRFLPTFNRIVNISFIPIISEKLDEASSSTYAIAEHENKIYRLFAGFYNLEVQKELLASNTVEENIAATEPDQVLGSSNDIDNVDTNENIQEPNNQLDSIPTPTSPTPTSMPLPTATNAPAPVNTKTISTEQILLQEINNYRSTKRKPNFTSETNTCNFASTRAKEVSTDFSHTGFRNRVDSNSLPYPSFSLVAENIALNTDSTQVVAGWIASPGHEENLLKDVPYACVANYGKYFVFEAWKP